MLTEARGETFDWSRAWVRRWALAALVLATFAVYSNTLRAPFVYDDALAITKNATIRNLWPLADVLRPQTVGGLAVSGRPVLNLSLALNYAISGDAAWSYHGFNLVVHVLAGLLLFGGLRRTFARRESGPSARWAGTRAADPVGHRSDRDPVAFVIAALWLLHPLQTESVSYVVQRAESLMGFFYLLTFYAFVRAVDVGAEKKRQWQMLAIAACALGMATKEVMVTAPVLVFLYDRAFVAGSFRAAWQQRRGFYFWLGSTWLLLGGLIAATGGNRGGTVGFGVDVPWWAYGLTQFQALSRYLHLSVWPQPLIFEYGTFWVQRAGDILPYALVILPLVAGTIVAGWRWPRLGFCGLWFFGILAVTSLVPGTIQMIVEHRMYLPLAGIIAPAVVGLHRGFGTRALVCGLVVAVVFGGLTFRRNRDYGSHLALWSDTVSKRPDNPRARQGLAEAYAELGQNDEAIAQYVEAVRLLPTEWKYHYNLALTLAGAGRFTEAIRHYELALRLSPNEPEAHNNLAVALVNSGHPELALAHYEAAVRLRPDEAQFHYNLGVARMRLERFGDAVPELAAAVRLHPTDADAHFNLAHALISLQRLEEGLAHEVEALRLKTADVEYRTTYGEALLLAARNAEAAREFQTVLAAHADATEARFGLASAFAALRRFDDAIEQYNALLRQTPAHAAAHFRLGDALVQVNRIPDAVREYESALALRPYDPEGHHNLGVAFARLERWNDAQREFETALRLKPDYPDARGHLDQLLRSRGK